MSLAFPRTVRQKARRDKVPWTHEKTALGLRFLLRVPRRERLFFLVGADPRPELAAPILGQRFVPSEGVLRCRRNGRDTGAAVPRFDILRSTNPADFTAAAYVESGGTDRIGSDAASPVGLFAYIVRVRNACAGNAGSRSDGVPRMAAACR
jgi:hypothetical protein